MQKLISYPLSVIYYLLYWTTLVVFQAIQWLCFNLFGHKAHRKSADIMLFFLVFNTYILGTRYKIENLHKLPTGVPLIIAVNHQSMFDFTTIGWFMRKIQPIFIGKIGLRKGWSGISYFFTHGGGELIDRRSPLQYLPALKKAAQYIEINKRPLVIFPEGMRSRTTSKPQPFKEKGLKILCEFAPSAYVVPITINNSWKMTRWGNFPMSIGNKIILTIHDSIRVEDMSFPEIFEKTEQTIVQAIIPD